MIYQIHENFHTFITLISINKWCCVKAVYEEETNSQAPIREDSKAKSSAATNGNDSSFATLRAPASTSEAESSIEALSEDSHRTKSPITSAQAHRPSKTATARDNSASTAVDNRKIRKPSNVPTTRRTPPTLPPKAAKKIIRKVKKTKTTAKFTEYQEDYEVDENGEKVDNSTTEAMKIERLSSKAPSIDSRPSVPSDSSSAKRASKHRPQKSSKSSHSTDTDFEDEDEDGY